MSRAAKTLAKMRNNPQGWRLDQVISLCQAYEACGVICRPPKRGSHYKVAHPAIEGILTIPADRPIKPVYIKMLVDFIDTVTDIIGEKCH